jgi:heptosyltransferase-2
MTPRHILIVHTAFLGDVVILTALIRAVTFLYPEARVDALVIPQTAGVLANNPHLGKVLRFNKRSGKLRAFIDTLRELRHEQYDLVLSPHSSFTTGLLLYLAGIPRRIGFDRNLARYLLTDRVPFLQGIHRGEKNLHLLHPLTKQSFPLITELFPAPDDSEYARQLPWPFPNAPKIAIAPASVWFTKQWPARYYAETIRELASRGYNVAVIGAANEREYCRNVIGDTTLVLELTGLSILRSAAVVGECDLVLCNDSGALHIANAMRTTVFAFFGPTVKRIGYFPFRPGDRVLETDESCRPCRDHGGTNCPLGHHHCMTRITPDSVVSTITETLPLPR